MQGEQHEERPGDHERPEGIWCFLVARPEIISAAP
jgi:hypothetical protein